MLIDQDAKGNMFCVLTDFGVCFVNGSPLLKVKMFRISSAAGISFPYAAPELFGQNENKNDMRPVDMYSLGIIMYELLNRKPAWTRGNR